MPTQQTTSERTSFGFAIAERLRNPDFVFHDELRKEQEKQNDRDNHK